jgi:hypothetical protein
MKEKEMKQKQAEEETELLCSHNKSPHYPRGSLEAMGPRRDFLCENIFNYEENSAL